MDELLQEMIAPAPSRSDKARRRRLVSTVIILALTAIGVTKLTTSALFTDNESVTSGNITTGTVDLTASGTPTFDVSSAGLAPGDAAFATVKVTNSGSLAYRYAVTYQATDIDTTPGDGTIVPKTATAVTSALLSTQLTLSAYIVGTGTGMVASCDSAGTTTATAKPLGSVGPGLATGVLTTFFGNPATGPHEGDRPLNANKDETLCLRVDLSTDATNDFQATSSTITLRFDAEQTVNNP